jgi:hypothetical protein
MKVAVSLMMVISAASMASANHNNNNNGNSYGGNNYNSKLASDAQNLVKKGSSLELKLRPFTKSDLKLIVQEVQNHKADVAHAAKYVEEAVQKYPTDRDALSITLEKLNYVIAKEADTKYNPVRDAAEQLARDAQISASKKRDVQASDQLRDEARKLVEEGTFLFSYYLNLNSNTL